MHFELYANGNLETFQNINELFIIDLLKRTAENT